MKNSLDKEKLFPLSELISSAEGDALAHDSGSGKRILLATSTGGNGLVTAVDTLIASALAIRGHEVEFLICDKALTGCEVAQFSSIADSSGLATPSEKNCESCFSRGSMFLAKFPFKTHKYSSYLGAVQREEVRKLTESLSIHECFAFVENQVEIGEQVRAGVIRFFGSSRLFNEDQEALLRVAREYLFSGIVTKRVFENFLEQKKPDVVVNHHGVYVPQGILDAVANREGVRVVVWGTSYRKGTFIFSHGDTYHKTFLTEPTSLWEQMPWTKEKEEHIWSYLSDRRFGKGDWSWVTADRGGIKEVKNFELIQSLGLSKELPTYCLLTNIGWDAQIFYANCEFDSMIEWLFFTIEHFKAHPNKQLIVRIHPHEIKSGNREFSGPLIRERFPVLPPNIVVVDKDSPFSTYDLMDISRAVILYGTKTGVEIAPFGMPVVVAADAWIRNKGISLDAVSKADYLGILNSLDSIRPLDDSVRLRALKFAYHYFFRRMIPLKAFDYDQSFPPVASMPNLECLKKGYDLGLDTIIDGILSGQPFIYESGN